MSLLEIAQWLGNGGVILLLLLMLVEVVPVKIYPIQWLGARLNHSVSDKVDKIDKKLDAHIAETYRNTILTFQRKLVNEDNVYTMEEWNKILSTCSDYNTYCEENKIKNDVVVEAIRFIKAEYQKALSNRDFLTLPIPMEQIVGR